jgi:hypothetical protein
MLKSAPIYFFIVFVLLTFGILSLLYFEPTQSVGVIAILGFIALIVSEYRSTSEVRETLLITNKEVKDALLISNTYKNDKLEDIKKIASDTYDLGLTTHTLVNSRYELALLEIYNIKSALYDLTGLPEHKIAADKSKQLLDEHRKAQKTVDENMKS